MSKDIDTVKIKQSGISTAQLVALSNEYCEGYWKSEEDVEIGRHVALRIRDFMRFIERRLASETAPGAVKECFCNSLNAFCTHPKGSPGCKHASRKVSRPDPQLTNKGENK